MNLLRRMGGPVEPSANERAGIIDGNARCAACYVVGPPMHNDPVHGWLCIEPRPCRERAEAQGLHLYPRRNRG